MALAGVLMAAALSLLITTTRVFHDQQVEMQSQDSARLSINQIARYLRAATSSADNLSSQSNAIATAQNADIEFFCDIDGDEMAEKVRYYLSGSNLRMQTSEPLLMASPEPHWTYPSYETDGILVQDGVSNQQEGCFRYFRRGDEGLEEFSPTSASLRREIVTVEVRLEVDEEPESGHNGVELATEVQLRQRYQGGLE